ncbi:hypothetical protein GCM10009789_72780 [Kribbella sancticallisti]|uniref:DUF222 domain-containing protein n=1 Tax=Kribbella sancticallisti TaxID=460087 RepID=A0ABP4QCW6_9ACTN
MTTPKHPPTWESVETELRRLLYDLRGADAAVVQVETARLRALAEQVEDDRDREHALFRAGQLPRLLAGPIAPSSPQFAQAQVLFAQAIGSSAEPADVRIPHLERIIQQIGALADESPPRERGAVRRLTSPLIGLIDHLEKPTE